VRADDSHALILDFTAVPLVDSAGIGALVGAYVSRQKDGRSLGLVGVNRRIHHALEVTRVESFFHFYGTVAEAGTGGVRLWGRLSRCPKKKGGLPGRPLFEFWLWLRRP